MQRTEELLTRSATIRPTHARYVVIAFGVTLAVLSFADRVVLSQSAPLIARDLGLDKARIGMVFAAFLLSYGLFEIPGAWYGDLVGARKGLLRIVAGWSVFTALTGWAWNYASLITVRFLFGAGEAGCFPIITKAFRDWLPQRERTRAQGILWMSARWGGAFTPLMVVFLLRYMSWRGSFLFFGAFGIIWAALYYRWYRDDPREHPSVNAAERELLNEAPGKALSHHKVPWGKLVRSRSVLLLCLQYFFLSFSWYFYLTWLPTYLREYHKLSSEKSATYAVIPLFFCGTGSLFCGFFTQRVVDWTGSVGRARRIMACAGFLGAGLFLALATRMHGLNSTMAMVAAACFFNDQVIPHAWAATMDIGGKHAASVAGMMNLMGNVAGTSSSVLGGYLLQRTGNNWNLFISILAGVYFLGIVCWPFIDTQTPIDEVD